MGILISTNMYQAGELHRVRKFLNRFPGQVGVEVFPLFDKPEYEEELRECLPDFHELPISFHGPYYKAEHSAKKGTEEYQKTMDMVQKTLTYSRELRSSYLVFHHNNCRVTDEKKQEMIAVSCENFREIEALYEQYGIPVLVENAGVIDRGNMLLNQEEFVNLCKKEQYPVLIDIGHAHANGWNLGEVMEQLKGQIVAYHVHNNDGLHDGHQRIRNGSLDFETFLADHKRLTPKAQLVLEYCSEVSSEEVGIEEDIAYLLKKLEE